MLDFSRAGAFAKMHSLGNNFVVVDARSGDLGDRYALDRYAPDHCAFARAVCHLDLGLAADGLVLLESSERCDFKMLYYNRDGSRAVCGNGLRCLARFVHEQILTGERPTQISFEIDSGTAIAEFLSLYDQIRLDMGSPVFNCADIPVLPLEDCMSVGLEVDSQTLSAAVVGMGNPHCIVFVDSLSRVDVDRLGPLIERHPLFPEKTNVEFVQVRSSTSADMKVWERGVGRTASCATGACAVAAAGISKGYLKSPFSLGLKYGSCELSWSGGDSGVLVTAPSELICCGILGYLPRL